MSICIGCLSQRYSTLIEEFSQPQHHHAWQLKMNVKLHWIICDLFYLFIYLEKVFSESLFPLFPSLNFCLGNVTSHTLEHISIAFIRTKKGLSVRMSVLHITKSRWASHFLKLVHFFLLVWFFKFKQQHILRWGGMLSGDGDQKKEPFQNADAWKGELFHPASFRFFSVRPSLPCCWQDTMSTWIC